MRSTLRASDRGRDTGEDAGGEHEDGDPGEHAPIGHKREIG